METDNSKDVQADSVVNSNKLDTEQTVDGKAEEAVSEKSFKADENAGDEEDVDSRDKSSKADEKTGDEEVVDPRDPEPAPPSNTKDDENKDAVGGDDFEKDNAPPQPISGGENVDIADEKKDNEVDGKASDVASESDAKNNVDSSEAEVKKEAEASESEAALKEPEVNEAKETEVQSDDAEVDEKEAEVEEVREANKSEVSAPLVSTNEVESEPDARDPEVQTDDVEVDEKDAEVEEIKAKNEPEASEPVVSSKEPESNERAASELEESEVNTEDAKVDELEASETKESELEEPEINKEEPKVNEPETKETELQNVEEVAEPEVSTSEPRAKSTDNNAETSKTSEPRAVTDSEIEVQSSETDITTGKDDILSRESTMDHLDSTASALSPQNVATPDVRSSQIRGVMMELEEVDPSFPDKTPENSVTYEIKSEASRSHAYTQPDQEMLGTSEITEAVEASETREASISGSSTLRGDEKERTDRVMSESLGVEYFDSFLNRQSALDSNLPPDGRFSESLGTKLSDFVKSEIKNWDSVREAVELDENEKEVPLNLDLVTAIPPPDRSTSEVLPASSFDFDGLKDDPDEEDVQKAGDTFTVKGSGDLELADMSPPEWIDPDEFSDSEEMVTGKCLCFTTSSSQKKVRPVVKEEEFVPCSYMVNKKTALTLGPEIDSGVKGKGFVDPGLELEIVEVRSMHHQGDTRLRGRISDDSSLHAGGWISLASTSLQYSWTSPIVVTEEPKTEEADVIKDPTEANTAENFDDEERKEEEEEEKDDEKSEDEKESSIEKVWSDQEDAELKSLHSKHGHDFSKIAEVMKLSEGVVERRLSTILPETTAENMDDDNDEELFVPEVANLEIQPDPAPNVEALDSSGPFTMVVTPDDPDAKDVEIVTLKCEDELPSDDELPAKATQFSRAWSKKRLKQRYNDDIEIMAKEVLTLKNKIPQKSWTDLLGDKASKVMGALKEVGVVPDEFQGIVVRGVPENCINGIESWIKYTLECNGYVAKRAINLERNKDDLHEELGMWKLSIDSAIPRVYQLVKMCIQDQPWYKTFTIGKHRCAKLNFGSQDYFTAFSNALRTRERINRDRRQERKREVQATRETRRKSMSAQYASPSLSPDAAKSFRGYKGQAAEFRRLKTMLDDNFIVQGDSRSWVQRKLEEFRGKRKDDLREAYFRDPLRPKLLTKKDFEIEQMISEDINDLNGWPLPLVEAMPEILLLGVPNLELQIFDANGTKDFEIRSPIYDPKEKLQIHITWNGIRFVNGHPSMALWGEGARNIKMSKEVSYFLSAMDLLMTIVIVWTAVRWFQNGLWGLSFLSIVHLTLAVPFLLRWYSLDSNKGILEIESYSQRFLSCLSLFTASQAIFSPRVFNCRVMRHEVIMKVYPQIVLAMCSLRFFPEEKGIDSTLANLSVILLISFVSFDSFIHRLADHHARYVERKGSPTNKYIGGVVSLLQNFADVFLRIASTLIMLESWEYIIIPFLLLMFECVTAFCVLIRDSYPYLCIVHSKLDIPFSELFFLSLQYGMLAMVGEYNFHRIPLGNRKGVIRVERVFRFFISLMFLSCGAALWGWPVWWEKLSWTMVVIYLCMNLVEYFVYNGEVRLAVT